MSPVYHLQRRLMEVGRIRLGDKGAGGQPQRLNRFRLTSASREILTAAAHLWGGEVREWGGGPSEGLFELYTETDALPIVVPPSAEPYTQWYELWSGGGCQRRCDGVDAIVAGGGGVRERRCLCQDGDRECKLTTRFSVLLPDIPGLGAWRCESHGYYAASEVTSALDLLSGALAAGQYVPGTLRLEQRQRRRPGEPTRRFVVPVIDLGVVVRDLLPATGGGGGRVLERGSRRPELPPGPPPPSGEAAGFGVGREADAPSPPAPGGLGGEAQGPGAGWGSPPPLPTDAATPPGGGDRSEDDRPITDRQRRYLMARARDLGLGSGRGADADLVSRIARYKTGRTVSQQRRRDMDPLLEALEAFSEHRERAEAKLVAWEAEHPRVTPETEDAQEGGAGPAAPPPTAAGGAPTLEDEERWRELARQTGEAPGGEE